MNVRDSAIGLLLCMAFWTQGCSQGHDLLVYNPESEQVQLIDDESNKAIADVDAGAAVVVKTAVGPHGGTYSIKGTRTGRIRKIAIGDSFISQHSYKDGLIVLAASLETPQRNLRVIEIQSQEE